MSMLDLFSPALRGFFGFGLRVPERGIQPTGPSVASATSLPVVATDERALQVSTVWACVRLLVQLIGMLPVAAFRQGPLGLERDNAHPLQFLLRYQPNPWQTPVEFFETMALHLVLRGNTYAYIMRGVDGVTPVALIPLPSDLVEVEVLQDRSVVYRYHSEKGIVIFAADSVLHVRLMGPGAYIGLSPLSYARFMLGGAVATEETAARYFVNGAKPSGVYMLDKILTKDQRELLREKFKQDHESPMDAWRTMVLEGGMKYEKISLSPEDSQMLESRLFNQSQICQFFGVPPQLVGITEKATTWGTGLEQMNLAFLAFSFQPYITRFEHALERRLLQPDERGVVEIRFDLEQLLRTDSTARAAYYSSLTQNGIMTRNEARTKEHLPRVPVAEADALTVQSAMTLLEGIGTRTASPASLPQPEGSNRGM